MNKANNVTPFISHPEGCDLSGGFSKEINNAWAIVELFTTLGPALLVNYFYKILETEKKHCLYLIKERELL